MATTSVNLNVKPLDANDVDAIQASATCLCWKRAEHMPPHLRVQEGKFKTADALEMHYSALFPPEGTPLRGVVLFLHGINEHSARYYHVFQELAEQQFGVLAYDIRSHGKSHMDADGKIAHVNRFQSTIDDTNDFISFAKRDVYPAMGVEGEPPLVLMGMSMGTLVALLTVLAEKHTFHGVVLVAPAVSVEWTPVLRTLSVFGSVMSSFAPTARLVPGVNEQWVCRDPLVGKDYDADPLTTREPLTCRMGQEMTLAMSTLAKEPRVEQPDSELCKLPILFMMGSDDKVTNLPLAKAFHARLASKDKQFIEVDGAYHVLFEDLERAHVMTQLTEWLNTRFPIAGASS